MKIYFDFKRSIGGKLLIGVLLDGSLILMYMIFSFTGFRSGIIKSLLTFINSIFSSFASFYFSKIFSNWIYDYYFKPSAIKYLVDNLNQNSFTTSEIIEKIPKPFEKILLNSGITFSNITHIISKVDKEILPERVAQIFKPIFIEFMMPLLSSIFFILFICIGRLIISLVLKILRLSGIKKLGKLIGSIFGVLKGYVIISIFMCCLRAMMPYCGNEINSLFSLNNISSTKVFKHMYINNPIYDVFERMNNT